MNIHIVFFMNIDQTDIVLVCKVNDVIHKIKKAK